MYAIIATGGKQYKVAEGDSIKIERLDAEVGSVVTFDQVLAVRASLRSDAPQWKMQLFPQPLRRLARGKKVIVYKYKPKLAIIRKTATDSFIPRLRLTRSTLNFV